MRFAKFLIPAVALGLFVAVPSFVARADDSATTQPATAGITVTVVDATGAPVVGARVTVPGKKHAPPLFKGVTDSNGVVTLTNIPAGKYRVQAYFKGAGRGMGKLVVADDGTASPLTITLKPKKADAAPASQPAANS